MSLSPSHRQTMLSTKLQLSSEFDHGEWLVVRISRPVWYHTPGEYSYRASKRLYYVFEPDFKAVPERKNPSRNRPMPSKLWYHSSVTAFSSQSELHWTVHLRFSILTTTSPGYRLCRSGTMDGRQSRLNLYLRAVRKP